jgi:hypothetical protein
MIKLVVHEGLSPSPSESIHGGHIWASPLRRNGGSQFSSGSVAFFHEQLLKSKISNLDFGVPTICRGTGNTFNCFRLVREGAKMRCSTCHMSARSPRLVADWAEPSRLLRSTHRVAPEIAHAGQEVGRNRRKILITPFRCDANPSNAPRRSTR